MIKTTAEAEAERVLNKKPSWGLFSSYSLAQTVHKAVELGWRNKLVQVRVEPISDDTFVYTVEPFEKDCNCPSILKYSDFYDIAPDIEENDG